MQRWLYALALWLLLGLTARAQDVSAKQLFEQGVAASEAGQWEEAARAFEASLAASDKPATRFNLMLAQRERKRPLEVARQALAFLALPAVAAREEARAKASALLLEAKSQLTLLDISGLPAGVSLQIDGKAPELVDAGQVYVRPGVHRLSLELDQHKEEIELLLSAGQTLPWPVLGRGEAARSPLPAAPLAPSLVAPSTTPNREHADAKLLAQVRTRAAWTTGSVGAGLAIAAVGLLWAAQVRGHQLSRNGLEGVGKDGYYSSGVRYQNMRHAIIPLAFAGGALMAAALPLAGRILRRGSLGWALASLALGGAALGVGTYYVIRSPGRQVPGTPLYKLGRQAGSLAAAASLPLLTYGIGFLVGRKQRAQLHLSGLSSVSVTW